MAPSLSCLERPPQRQDSVLSSNRPYSVVLPETEKGNRGSVRRCGFSDAASCPHLSVFGCRTLYEVFQRAIQIRPEGPCLGQRMVDSYGTPSPYHFHTYNVVGKRIDHLACGLNHASLVPPNSSGLKLLGIYSRNCPEWVIAEQAGFAIGGTIVTVFQQIGLKELENIINQAELSTIICGGTEELVKITGLVASGRCNSIRNVILIEGVPADSWKAAESSGIVVWDIHYLEADGASHPSPHSPPSPDDVAIFCYTSGSTGESKGAMITHVNLISNYASSIAANLIEVTAEDIYVSYMPLPHIYEHHLMLCCYAVGAPIGFTRGDPTVLFEDIIALRPTIMPAVPRILNRLHDKIVGEMLVKGGLKSVLFRKACEQKVAGLYHGHTRHALWDRLVFDKIKTALGMDRLRLVTTGSAPCAAHVLTFMRILVGCPVIEGYGMTETAATSTASQVGDFSTGHVGGPHPGVDICLKDVPEMDYLHTDSWHGKTPIAGGEGGGIPCMGRGEILVRGPCVFNGYYKMPEETKNVLGSDGWLHTGDIGLWTADGALMIIDRKKSIFKLSQGMFVAPERIENIIIQASLISQSYVYGNSLGRFPVAIIVPDEEAVQAWVASTMLQGESYKEICSSEELQAAINAQIHDVSKRANLHKYERLCAFHIEPEPFSTESGILTPTLKLRRANALKRYKGIFQTLYEGITNSRPRSRI